MNSIVDKCLKFKGNSFSFDWEYIDTIPEFHKLKDCNQSPYWHGEGNAWNHTVSACNSMLCLCDMIDDKACTEEPWVKAVNTSNYSPVYIKKLLLISTLFHDIGKINTTFEKDGKWHSYGHEKTGEKITRRLLWDEDNEFREDICFCVREHMRILKIWEEKEPYYSLFSLSQSGKVGLVLLVKFADLMGSKQDPSEKKDLEYSKLNLAINAVINANCFLGPFKTWFSKGRYPWTFSKDTLDVYVMIGLPGSGKNTYIDCKMHEDFSKYLILSRDDIREELGFTKPGEKAVCSHEQENIVTELFNSRLINAANNGQPVVINNINLKKSYRDSVKELLKKYNVKYTYIIIETSIENIKSRRDFMTDDVITGMLENFDYPLPEEYDKLYIVEN